MTPLKTIPGNLESSPRLLAAVQAISRGEMVILIDSEDRENEGDLVLAAEFATAEKINFFIRKACGLVCLALESDQVDRLGLPPMVTDNGSPRKTAFTISVEAASGVSTGISAQDRAHTIRVAADPKSTRVDLVSPGHIFPLRAVKGGVLERAGHTEGSIELCKLAGLNGAAVICEIINEDGTMARRPDLEKFAALYQIPICTIEELIQYLAVTQDWIKAGTAARFPTRFGSNVDRLKIQAFQNTITGTEHVVLRSNDLKGIPWVRIHSECLTGDALGSMRCDCGEQLAQSIETISALTGPGVVIYLKNQEGRGIGLFSKIEAYALQDQGLDTYDANIQLGYHPDQRSYRDAAKILLEMGIRKIRLSTHNPDKVSELKGFGIEVVEQISEKVSSNPENTRYLETKRDRFAHQIDLQGSV
jgi:3,4-dihydroxy 2-butanone 4-phosphate synthase/GTP cyclohydrolase II